MNREIKVLDDLTINKIAAGEVVERPVAVVKELVDNAIDAEATQVSINLENGGKSLIRVDDNGFGMNRDQCLLSIERHATSKIANADDLRKIVSRGFRGEALPSIAAVSRFRLKSRSQDSQAGTLLRLEGGVIKGVDITATGVGTSVEVKNLFFNTPARKKFLRSPESELAKIKNLVKAYSISHPEISFELVDNQKTIYNFPALSGVSSEFNRGEGIFSDSSLSFKNSDETYSISGLLSLPAAAINNARNLLILVNNRLVSDKLLIRAIKDAYGIALKGAEYPKGYIHLKVPPSEIDLNVHPQKTEVRFDNPGRVFQFVTVAITQALRSYGQSYSPEKIKAEAPLVYQSEIQSYEYQAPSAVESKAEQIAFLKANNPEVKSANIENVSLSTKPGEPTDFPAFSDLKYIGKALDCYLICEHDEALYIVDMHAAHERYNYNLVRNNWSKKQVSSQRLLLPVTIRLDAESLARATEYQELLNEIGFEYQKMGEDSLMISAIPNILKERNPKEFFAELLNFENEDMARQEVQRVVDYIAARIACHASIRSGHHMTSSAVYSLFDNLDQSEFAAACPHGRPVIVKMSKLRVEQLFGRA